MHLHVSSGTVLESQCICMYMPVMQSPSDITVTAWARLVRAHNQALSCVEKALKKNKLPPLVWYDVLLELERAGSEGLRPYELERELLLPQYGISRLIERIEKDGYLQRDVCEDDKRGQRLVITKAGMKLRQNMWLVYGSAIEEAVGRKLTSDQSKKLSELLAELVQ